jgi:NADH pyrophosphatase NudC (nudix superfamily)
MDIGALLLLLALVIVVGLYLAQPFMGRRSRAVTVDEHERSTLLAERERIITALQELDFDFKLGKVPSEDYPLQRQELLQKGAEVLRRIDEMEASLPAQPAEARLEAAIASRRADSAPATISDDDLESLISARRSEHKQKSGGFCPQCGKPVFTTDKFCPGCGKSLL